MLWLLKISIVISKIILVLFVAVYGIREILWQLDFYDATGVGLSLGKQPVSAKWIPPNAGSFYD